MAKLETALPPFRNDAPPFYNNGVWGTLGCAVPQTGKYLHTSNGHILDLATTAGSQIFHVLWQYDDRKFETPPSRPCVWEVYQLVVIARKRLADMTFGPEETPPPPMHTKPAVQMFKLYPVPFYGRRGCINGFLHSAADMALRMITEMMEHSDNERASYFTPSFQLAAAPYLQSILILMATKLFGYARKEASAPEFVIPDDKWKTYNPMLYAVSVEGTSTRPEPGWSPTEQDLEPIRGLPASQVTPFLQPWPETRLVYSEGGVWTPSLPLPETGGSATTTTTGPATAAFPVPSGPPS